MDLDTPLPPAPICSLDHDSPSSKHGIRFWAIIIALGVTNLLGALENTVVTTSGPTIVSDLGLGADAAFQPLFGQLANIFGRRWVTLFIVATFTLGSGICGGAKSGGMLIAGRALQGVGSGGMQMLIVIIISDLVPLRQRGNYQAVILAIYGIGTTLGPFIGGIIVEKTTWRWVFYINLPIGGVSLLMLYLSLHVNYNREMSFSQRMKRLDFVGNGILMTSAVAILYALTYGGSKFAWSSWHILVPMVLGFCGLIVFAVYERSSLPIDPVMPPRLFTHRTSLVVAVNTWLNSALLYWGVYFLPVYFQAVRSYSPARSGVALLPQSLVAIPGAAISAIALSKWGKFKPLHFSGFALFAFGMGLMSLLKQTTSIAEWVVFQCITAVGAGMILNTLLPSFQAPIEEADQAAGTAAWCFIRSFGNIWGVAIPAVIFNNRFDHFAPQISDLGAQRLFTGGDAYQYASSSFIDSYPSPVSDEIREVYRRALQVVFAAGTAFAGLAFLLVFLEKEVPLRTKLETEYGLKDTRVNKPKNVGNEKPLGREAESIE
ncbi:hypothetical protein NHQ30_000430 [Ciborinia camelliae]|nr:hypothetical protein NHQ30_000430 [Ciborinia camelliae]